MAVQSGWGEKKQESEGQVSLWPMEVWSTPFNSGRPGGLCVCQAEGVMRTHSLASPAGHQEFYFFATSAHCFTKTGQELL